MRWIPLDEITFVDVVAVVAMFAGMLRNSAWEFHECHSNPDGEGPTTLQSDLEIADDAYQMAHTMLKVRESWKE